MIGRLINGKSYIPFYMNEKYMYDEIKRDDIRQRSLPLISRVNGLGACQRSGQRPADWMSHRVAFGDELHVLMRNLPYTELLVLEFLPWSLCGDSSSISLASTS